MSAIKRVARELNRAGLRGVLKRLAPARVEELLYVRDLSSDGVPGSEDVRWQIQRYDDALRSGERDVDRRLRAGSECYLVRVDGRIVHQSWLTWDVRLPTQFGFEPAPVIGECFTDGGFRNRGIYRHVLRHIAADIGRRKAASKVYVLVSPENAASIRGVEQAGFRRVAHLRGHRVLGFLVQSSVNR